MMRACLQIITTMMPASIQIVATFLTNLIPCQAFIFHSTPLPSLPTSKIAPPTSILGGSTRQTTYDSATFLFATNNPKSKSQLSPLPKGISPFEKSLSKKLDIQAEFRRRAKNAIDAAIASDVKLLEIEFPPLLGGYQSKSQFDDFDNIQELDKNKDWTMLLAPMFLGEKFLQAWHALEIECYHYLLFRVHGFFLANAICGFHIVV